MKSASPRYFVVTGYGGAVHARAFLAAAESEGLAPSGVLEVRPYSAASLTALARRLDGRQLSAKLRASVRDRVFRTAGTGDETTALRAWIAHRGLALDASVQAWCARAGVARRSVPSLKDPRAASYVRAGGFAFGVYLGGGIVPASLIRALPGPLLNAHQGPLPAVRGMNAVEWALYLALTPEVTVHAIDDGIDTGPVCLRRPLAGPHASLASARSASLTASVELLVEAVRGHVAGTLAWTPQDVRSGRQYFAMHPLLADALNARLAAKARA